jgi:phosphatidylserine decarboxylase
MSALTYATAQLLHVVPRATVGRALGKLADHRWNPALGRAVVNLYSRAYDLTFDECERTEGFTSFDDFFTRGLKSGVRPIDSDARTIVSPADGRIESMGRVDGRTFRIKGNDYRVEDLVGDVDDAKRYAGGGGCVVYLSPRDYHRVHSPVDGKIALVRSMRGDYYPVNAIGMLHVKNLFARNRRVAIAIDTPALGRVTVVMVAAMVVGRITVSGISARDVPFGARPFEPPRAVKRGDEIGMFHLGSTAVIFLEPRAFERWTASEGEIRYGEPVARAPASEGVPEHHALPDARASRDSSREGRQGGGQ